MALQPGTSVKTLAPSDPHAITETLNPKTKHFEFGGPVGAVGISILVPLMVYIFHLTCSELSGGCPPPMLSLPSTLYSARWWNALWNTQAFLVYLGWYAYIVLCWKFIPGDWVEGGLMRNGERKKYKMNGFATALLTVGVVAGLIYRNGPLHFTYIYDNWLALVTSSALVAFVQAMLVYINSYRKGALLALGGNSGNIFYDWFIGRELNPSTPWLDSIGFDLKTFNELRPGLILWMLADISCACEQTIRLGKGSFPTDSMLLVCAFQSLYVLDSLFFEQTILSQMDIVTDGFGFMLAIGDLCWLPFSYSLQARYLAFRPIALGPVWVVIIVLINAAGYFIFRTANNDKDAFRKGQNPKHFKTLKTKRGTELMISGLWGLSRHPNYLGDLLMGLAWCLTTGFRTPITYFYIIYFTILLVHRGMRDDAACVKKYGEDWVAYKKIVKYRILPYVF